jgi:two-component system C4-dicarboxylate transport sensor histidine kinase DctB
LQLSRRRVLSALVAVVTIAGLAGGTWWFAEQRGVERVESGLRDRLTINLRAVESEIERYRYLPDVISQDERIVRVLAQAGAPGPVAVANAYLQTVRAMSGADEIYVLDLHGETLAASNWNEPGSFVGHNYAFRPYFIDAMNSGAGRFYAVGVTTGKPGYFLSSRVEVGSQLVGVVVAKVDMAPLAQTWARAGELTAVSDSDGIVFLSGEPRWTYHPLHGLSEETVARLQMERRYDGTDIGNAETLAPVAKVGADSLPIRFDGAAYLLGRSPIEPDGWQLLTALPLQPVQDEARLMGGLAALLGLLALGVLLYLNQRRQIVRLKLEQNFVLERKVAERTKALAHEVEERKRAEIELRGTQESLIHAAKLAALGRMSAAIVHEVSQPLSALDNTLAAAGLHAERQATSEVQRNLTSARNLLKRMQRTVKHLKTFSSRRDMSPPEAVDVNSVIEAAMEIVAPRARQSDVVITFVPQRGVRPVSGNAIRLEQVFINLLLNGIDATAAAGNSEVSIATESAGKRLRIAVADAGGGISEAVRERLFEPFFTTKTTGEGLGLGLSISRTILEEFDGTLDFTANAAGGTLVTVDLPLFVQRPAPAEMATA